MLAGFGGALFGDIAAMVLAARLALFWPMGFDIVRGFLSRFIRRCIPIQGMWTHHTRWRDAVLFFHPFYRFALFHHWDRVVIGIWSLVSLSTEFGWLRGQPTAHRFASLAPWIRHGDPSLSLMDWMVWIHDRREDWAGWTPFFHQRVLHIAWVT